MTDEKEKEVVPIPTRHAKVDVAGNLVAFYCGDIHAAIPPDAVLITEVQYHQWLSGQSENPMQRYRLVNGTLVAIPIPPPTLAQKAQVASGAGLTITLSGSVTLTATLFPTDASTQRKISTTIAAVDASGDFSGGASSYPMKDSAGVWHAFTLEQYKAVAASILSYVSTCDLIIDGNPLRVSTLPTSIVNLTV